MILQFLGFIAIIIFTVFTVKTAKENGRNAPLWAAAVIGIGLGLQFVLPILVIIIVSIALILTGTPPNQVESAVGWWAFGVTFLSLALSLIGMFLILRHVAQLPEKEDVASAPPPPPTF